MNKRTLIEYSNWFRSKAEDKKLVIFVGAGVSSNTEGMPSWNKLIHQMAKEINYSKCDYCNYKNMCKEKCPAFDEFCTDDFLKIPQYVYNKDKNKYYEIIKKNISSAIDIDTPLASVIFDINPVHIITTNYDKLIESSSNIFCEQYEVIVGDKDLLKSEKTKYIVKMHGDISDCETIVLKEDDYLRYSQNHVLIELFLKSLLTNHIILFLGYSLNDYNIKIIIGWLNHMRMQNDLIGDDPIGYILLDDEEINSTQTNYFSGNNIEVVNLKEMPEIEKIPNSINNERGKRLYGFLKSISDSSLDTILSNKQAIENSINLMYNHKFIDYTKLFEYLYIRNYDKINDVGKIYDKKEFEFLKEFLESKTEYSEKLKHIFLNSGISKIRLSSNSSEVMALGNYCNNDLFSNKHYQMYLDNEFDKLIVELENEECDLFEKYFYISILFGYTEEVYGYFEISTEAMSTAEKVNKLHNDYLLEITRKYIGVSKYPKNFILNINNNRERNLFSKYLDIYEGSSRRFSVIRGLSEKLKSDAKKNISYFGENSNPTLYKMKNETLNEYFFYFSNHIFFKNFNEISNLFNLYVDAIMCSSSYNVKKTSDFFGLSLACAYSNKKYSIDMLDLDIIVKFTSVKFLYDLIEDYNVCEININEDGVDHLCRCFKNICESFININLNVDKSYYMKIIVNLLQLLSIVELDDKYKSIIDEVTLKIFIDDNFWVSLLTFDNPDYSISIKILYKLLSKFKLNFNNNILIVEKIIKVPRFYDFLAHINFCSFRKMIDAFLKNADSKELQKIVAEIIDKETINRNKISLIRLFFNNIYEENLRKNYVSFISDNFSELNSSELIDFVFGNWIKLSEQDINNYLNKIVKDFHEQDKVYPDKVKYQLECVYLLNLNNKIANIGILNELKEDNPHLQFLIEPEIFDYTKVDFSNYMWQNFAKNSEYRLLFIDHKQEILPRCKENIKSGNSDEMEKKILYGFLLGEDEIFNFKAM